MVRVKRIFDKEYVIEMMREALDIVEELDPPDELLALTFQTVVNVLGQHEMMTAGGVNLPNGFLPPR